MEFGAFRSFKMAMGMAQSPPATATAAASSSSSSSSLAATRRAESDSSSAPPSPSPSADPARELNLPLGQDFVPLAQDKDSDLPPLTDAEDVDGDDDDDDNDDDDDDDDDDDRVRDPVFEDVVCMIFDLPRATKFYKDFSCAIAATFAMHGRMYPTSSHVCFYSNVFGRERKILIPYETITDISKTTTFMFQSALQLATTTGESYVFTSFWGDNRDRCLELLLKLRRGAVPGDDTASRAGLTPPASESESASPSSFQALHVQVPQSLPRTVSDPGLVATPRDISMERVLDETFAISVDAFLAAFVRDGASFGLDAFHRQNGATEIQVDPWRQAAPDDDATLGDVRALQFRVPIDAPIGPKSSVVDVLQCLKQPSEGCWTMESSTRLVDIPYGDYFSVEERWTVRADGGDDAATRLCIELKVVFSKSTFWRSTIESRARTENADKWQRWAQLARQHLAAMRSPPSRPPSRTPSPRKRSQSRRSVTPEPIAASPRVDVPPRRNLLPLLFPWLVIVVLVITLIRLQAAVARIETALAHTNERLLELSSSQAQTCRGSTVS
ncbi:hypothetical protein ATCC90586_009915 [Pythium insidiosum]|nr:hypothetical protein ATCC90586_009915 [Pythium insidiosum]